MFGPPEPADRLWFDVPSATWKRERTTVQVGLHVEDMGSTNGIIFLQDEAGGERTDIIVGRRPLQRDEDPAADEERILTHVKIMCIARWYAGEYNALVGRVPRTTPVKFLKTWAYILVSRSEVPMLRVERFAPDFGKFTYDAIPPGLDTDHGEVDASFLFALFTFEQSGGNLLICNPLRVSHGLWGRPQFATTDEVGGVFDGGKKFMWEFMVSDVHQDMKMSYGLNVSRRDIFLRTLRMCLIQSKSGLCPYTLPAATRSMFRKRVLTFKLC